MCLAEERRDAKRQTAKGSSKSGRGASKDRDDEAAHDDPVPAKQGSDPVLWKRGSSGRSR